ncbi:hypothetical protein BKA82DRAFT_14203 [Pisolithus tinctorius]|uniref:Uncharacterized protein n=1 Tax=Pisolithus tinctorius Marx 270 TaxID=870435 RepID=A0A0C3KHC4_PISTI|nr:hypothetical protein BKA82DRAFT_14203 [Pisolithus tinctorius]KIO08997.1 hypothetical protein M404DRAFT_14203 [Pisolithus tinctorius Marx 270]
MAFQQDVVSGEQYRYALTNFRIAHEKVEEQRRQLEEQERQIGLLRARIALLEGTAKGPQDMATKQGGTSVDDFSIKNAASQLERLINRWAAEVVRSPPASLDSIYAAAISDITGNNEPLPPGASAVQVQNILRHVMSEMISAEVINCLIVTNSGEANVQLTRIHEHLFSRNPMVAAVWRRQTFSAAVDSCDTSMAHSIFDDQMPSLVRTLGASMKGALSIFDAAYNFSRMLHGANASGSSADAFYRSFVPEVGSALLPRQIELIRRCLKSEQGEVDRVGATIFPGLVKVGKAATASGEQNQDSMQTIVRRAQVICECALLASVVGVAPLQH